MQISGIQAFTALDYPGKLACIVFTVGCNFRCGYCHNPEFILPEKIKELKDTFIPEEVFFNFLEKRKGLLDAVVICGGEPSISSNLKEFIIKIKAMGFLVKLDTNGSSPKLIRDLIDSKLIDYIAMDFKTSLGAYKQLVGNVANEAIIEDSLELIKSSGIDYEIRTTLIKEIHSENVLRSMRESLKGIKRLYLQKFRNGTCLDSSFESHHPFSEGKLKEAKDFFRKEIPEVACR